MGHGLLGYIWRGPIERPRRRTFSLDQSAAGRLSGRSSDRNRAARKARRRAQKRARY